MKLKRNITLDYILSKVSAYDIYAYYMPWPFKLNKNCLSPFKSENYPSFIIGNKLGKITHKAFNGSESGDCVDFVGQMFRLNHVESLEKIAEDFGLKDVTTTRYERIIASIEKPIIEEYEEEPLHFLAKAKAFTQQHIDYLAEGFLEPKDLNISEDTKAYALQEWYVNKQRQSMKYNEVAFFYNLKNERGDWIKIYRPFVDKLSKWRTNIPFTEMHGVSNIKNCKISIIAKSVKDAAFLKKYISSCVCVVQAEDISAISEENIKIITESSERVFLSFDNDEKGVRASKEITEKTGWSYINPPKDLLQYNVSDWFDMAKYYKTPEAVQDYFKSKGLL